MRQQESEKQRTLKLVTLGRLAGGVAHDFNNILSIIIMHCDLILQELPRDHAACDSALQIKKSGERAAVLARQLLAFTRKEATAVEIIDLNGIVFEMARMLERMLGEKIKIHLGLKATRSQVMADPALIEQVIMNLALNARDAMPDGGVLTFLSANDPSESVVFLSVRDTGVGMDEETKKQIFEPLFSTKKGRGGNGLGLCVVEEVVRRCGWQIRVESEPGKGSTFMVSLPLALEEKTKCKLLSRENPVREAQVKLEPASVLLVEDDAPLRLVLSQALELSGFRVLAPDPNGELRSLLDRADLKVDLMITDVVLPGMSGPEVAERLHRDSPQTKVLFMSGYRNDELRRFSEAIENSYFLQKPFSASQLLKKIREMLN